MTVRPGGGTAALQDCLSFTYEAMYAYGLIAGRMEDDTAVRERAERSYRRHRERRDDVLALLDASDDDPVQPNANYRVPAVGDADEAVALGQAIESRNAAAYLRLVGVSDGDDRTFAITALRQVAVDALDWGADPEALPGT